MRTSKRFVLAHLTAPVGPSPARPASLRHVLGFIRDRLPDHRPNADRLLLGSAHDGLPQLSESNKKNVSKWALLHMYQPGTPVNYDVVVLSDGNVFLNNIAQA
jgi:hypothetical protein